jgi:hypothetical protein
MDGVFQFLHPAFFTGEPGQTVSQVITFSNTSNAELNFVAT